MNRKSNMIYFLSIVLSVMISGCVSEKMDDNHALVRLKVLAPEGVSCSFDNVYVNLQQVNSPVTYRSKANKDGIAEFDVEYGFYKATSQFKEYSIDNVYLMNSTSENFRIDNTNEQMIEMNTVYSSKSKLIFKEIYYSGCLAKDGKRYMKDPYLIIYNNSVDVTYLDSLCIGSVAPTNAQYSNTGWETVNYVPIFNFMWMIPGSGKDYPLEPGQQVVLSFNAINHLALGQTNSVDLSNSDWVMYDESANLTQQTPPAPGVKKMQLCWRYLSATASMGSFISPAWIMWKVKDMSMEQYLKDYNKLHPTGADTRPYLVVPNDWIIDGAEFIRDAGNVMRLPSTVDNAAFQIEEGMASGLSAIRKVDETESTPERIVYQDTNNSANDFEKSTPSLKQ